MADTYSFTKAAEMLDYAQSSITGQGDRIIIMDKGKKILEGKPRELLSLNLEKFVMEIYNESRYGKVCSAYFDNNGIRYEVFKDTLFAYSDDSEKLSDFGETLRTGDYYIRPANLEDLFLKVTGRILNELQ